jgi:hypothetical protein
MQSGPLLAVSQLKFVERKLREARTAPLADEALLEVRSAVVAMRRMIDYIESAGQELA